MRNLGPVQLWGCIQETHGSYADVCVQIIATTLVSIFVLQRVYLLLISTGISSCTLSTWRSDNEVAGLVMWGSWRQQLRNPNMKYNTSFSSAVYYLNHCLLFIIGTCQNLSHSNVSISSLILHVPTPLGSWRTLRTITFTPSSPVNATRSAYVYLLYMLRNLVFRHLILARCLVVHPVTICYSNLWIVSSILMNGNVLHHSGALFLGLILW